MLLIFLGLVSVDVYLTVAVWADVLPAARPELSELLASCGWPVVLGLWLFATSASLTMVNLALSGCSKLWGDALPFSERRRRLTTISGFGALCLLIGWGLALGVFGLSSSTTAFAAIFECSLFAFALSAVVVVYFSSVDVKSGGLQWLTALTLLSAGALLAGVNHVWWACWVASLASLMTREWLTARVVSANVVDWLAGEGAPPVVRSRWLMTVDYLVVAGAFALAAADHWLGLEPVAAVYAVSWLLTVNVLVVAFDLAHVVSRSPGAEQ